MISPRTPSARAGAVGLLAGLAGSLCCLGPSAAILLGAGSSSALWGLALGRGPALALGGALLGLGLVLALWRARACGLRGRARWRQPALLLASAALSYALLGLLLPYASVWQEQPPSLAAAVASPAHAPAARRMTLIVEKMVCPPCASHVRTMLGRKAYVRAFSAEAGDEQVTIDYDPAQISAADLAKLFPRRFGVSLISDVALSG